jgi:putative membrane protein
MPDVAAPNSPEKDPRVYFAAERTLLAWIRTGLALMGFGFAIARFGLFLRQMQAAQTSLPVHSSWGSPLAGVILIALGVLVNLTGSFQYARTIRQLSEGAWIPGRLSRTGIALAILLAILGALMAAYLLYLH